jgi:predicted acyltransferase|nr:hypothetical protein [uncultured Lachnoclostridium sp.]
MALDFQAALENFSNQVTGGNDPISSIYNIIPTYSARQQKLLFLINYFIAKWELDDIEILLREVKKIASNNKNLGMIQQQSLKSLLAAYTQNELVRGIKVQAIQNNTPDQ